MRRLGLLLLPLCIACDLKEKEIGDSGNVGDSADESGDGGNVSDSDGEGSDEGVNCTAIGCDDGLFIELLHGGLVDGNHQVRVTDAQIRPLFSCDFNVVGGNVEDSDCLVFELPDRVTVMAPLGFPNPVIEVRRDNIVIASGIFTPAYEEQYPNGVQCGAVCTQGHVTLPLGEPSCASLETEFWTEYDAVRRCEDASDCGQVMEGTSCGCTRDWVARNDADLARFYELWEAGSSLECEWALFGSTCDCPEVDGFACVENVCTWNYL